MKKFILFIFTVLFFSLNPLIAKAEGIMPRYSATVNYYGIGVYFAPQSFSIYEEPNEESRIVETVEWNEIGIKMFDNKVGSREIFIAFVPEKDIALMSVTDEMDGWCKVIYNQDYALQGWIKNDSPSRFLTWYEVMNKYGKENGLYYFIDIPKDSVKMYTNPDESSQIVNKKMYYTEKIELKFIRGNWMLVKVFDYDNAPIGWIKWRDNNGRLLVFPKF